MEISRKFQFLRKEKTLKEKGFAEKLLLNLPPINFSWLQKKKEANDPDKLEWHFRNMGDPKATRPSTK